MVYGPGLGSLMSEGQTTEGQPLWSRTFLTHFLFSVGCFLLSVFSGITFTCVNKG